jgi:hypothetical protein
VPLSLKKFRSVGLSFSPPWRPPATINLWDPLEAMVICASVPACPAQEIGGPISSKGEPAITPRKIQNLLFPPPSVHVQSRRDRYGRENIQGAKSLYTIRLFLMMYLANIRQIGYNACPPLPNTSLQFPGRQTHPLTARCVPFNPTEEPNGERLPCDFSRPACTLRPELQPGPHPALGPARLLSVPPNEVVIAAERLERARRARLDRSEGGVTTPVNENAAGFPSGASIIPFNPRVREPASSQNARNKSRGLMTQTNVAVKHESTTLDAIIPTQRMSDALNMLTDAEHMFQPRTKDNGPSHPVYADALLSASLDMLAECVESGSYEPGDLVVCADRIRECQFIPQRMREHLSSCVGRLYARQISPRNVVLVLNAAAWTLRSEADASLRGNA